MMKFQRKVNPKEGLLGIYISSKELDQQGLQLVDFFYKFFQKEKKKALLTFPLIMMVDPTLQDHQLGIKVRYDEFMFTDNEFGNKFFAKESNIL